MFNRLMMKPEDNPSDWNHPKHYLPDTMSVHIMYSPHKEALYFPPIKKTPSFSFVGKVKGISELFQKIKWENTSILPPSMPHSET